MTGSAPRATTRLLMLLSCCLTWTAVTGCSTHAQRIREARQQFYHGELATAAEVLSDQADREPRDADVLMLDLAVVELVSGRPEESERILRRARDAFSADNGQAVVDSTLSMLTDDQRRVYAGEDYEQVLVRVFLALSNLLRDGQDAEAYALQITATQDALRQRALEAGVDGAGAAYSQLAIGPYLRGLLREATLHDYDDAERAYEQVVSWEPDFQAGRQDLLRVRQASHSRPKHGVLYVFALVDQGPIKEQTVEIPTSQALLVADRILSAFGEYDVPPTLAPIKVPRVVVPARQIDNVLVLVNGQAAGQTETVCDIAALAQRQHEVQFPHIMARAVARRVIKKASIYAVKDHLELENAWTDLALSAVGVAWEATEAADTRCWGVLPREIQVLRLELPVGPHDIALRPVFADTSSAQNPHTTVDIVDGRNTYLLAYLVGGRTIGQILHRTP